MKKLPLHISTLHVDLQYYCTMTSTRATCKFSANHSMSLKLKKCEFILDLTNHTGTMQLLPVS